MKWREVLRAITLCVNSPFFLSTGGKHINVKRGRSRIHSAGGGVLQAVCEPQPLSTEGEHTTTEQQHRPHR